MVSGWLLTRWSWWTTTWSFWFHSIASILLNMNNHNNNEMDETVSWLIYWQSYFDIQQTHPNQWTNTIHSMNNVNTNHHEQSRCKFIVLLWIRVRIRIRTAVTGIYTHTTHHCILTTWDKGRKHTCVNDKSLLYTVKHYIFAASNFVLLERRNFVMHFNFTFTQSSISIYKDFERQTEFSRVYNFTILSNLLNLQKIHAHKKNMFYSTIHVNTEQTSTHQH